MAQKKVTTRYFSQAKESGEKISILTAYDYSTAKLIDEAGVDAILVGDSLGMVVLGYDSTIPVTMEDMIHHIKAVARGTERAMVIGDMPFMSYHISRADALKNAGRLLQEGGAQAVKLEGGREVADSVKAIIDAGIPVMGHLGLTPQSVNKMGGYVVQGKDEDGAKRLLEDAKILEQMGVFSLVLECVPTEVAELITKNISIPTIGIGAGPACDGQVLVTHDLLGIYNDLVPKFVKRYADLKNTMIDAVKSYTEEVKAGVFPEPKHSFSTESQNLKKVY